MPGIWVPFICILESASTQLAPNKMVDCVLSIVARKCIDPYLTSPASYGSAVSLATIAKEIAVGCIEG